MTVLGLHSEPINMQRHDKTTTWLWTSWWEMTKWYAWLGMVESDVCTTGWQWHLQQKIWQADEKVSWQQQTWHVDWWGFLSRWMIRGIWVQQIDDNQRLTSSLQPESCMWWCDRDLLCVMTWQWAALMMMLKQHKNRLECWPDDQQYWPTVEQRQVIDELM